MVLDALVTLEVVQKDADGSFALGPAAPEPAAMPSVRHHARAMRRWATSIEAASFEARRTPSDAIDPETFHDALSRNAQKVAPEVVDVVPASASPTPAACSTSAACTASTPWSSPAAG